MNPLLELAKLCERLIKSQQEELEAHPLTLDTTKKWCEGRENAWLGILDYCYRALDDEAQQHFDEWRSRGGA